VASLALIVSLMVLVTIFIGPLAYLSAKLNLPTFITYILGIISILNGIFFCSLAIPIWYLGLVPIYFGYISILRANKKETQG
jgi:hypothetical protein